MKKLIAAILCCMIIIPTVAVNGSDFSFSYVLLHNSQNVFSKDGDTAYLAGSIAKSFAAELAEVLCREGVLSRDATAYGLTIDQIINQKNGFYPYSGSLLGFFSEDRDKKLDALKHLPRGNEKYSYQNITFCALEVLIENATGLTYRDALKKYLLDTVGLYQSDSGFSYYETMAKRSYPIFSNSQAVPNTANRAATSFEAAAGFITTANDLAKWINYIHQNGRLTDAYDRGTPISEGLVYYRGWFIEGDTAYSSGSLFGTGAVAAFSISRGDGVVLMCTGDTSRLVGLAKSILEGTPLPYRSTHKTYNLPSDKSILDICGVYENPIYGKVSVTLENGEYHLHVGEIVLPLYHVCENLYKIVGFSEDFWRMVPGLRYIYFETLGDCVTAARIEGVYTEGLGTFNNTNYKTID